ncbi:MAG: OmpA family protein [Myxococcota bacterium]
MSCALLAMAAPVRADEPWLLSAEGSAAMAVSEPQRTLFAPGWSGSAALHRPLLPWVSLGVRLRYGYLFEGEAPADPGRVNPGAGSFLISSAAMRLRPLAWGDEDVRRGTGLWVEGGAGGGLTGDIGRGAVEAAVGWGIEAGSVDVSPVVRYLQIIQPANRLDGRDARILLMGLEITLFDARPEPPPEPAPPEREEEPSDRDGDGIVDEEDACPDEPEDPDGFEDEDGCPDPDNDSDGVLDADDGCPLEPEDYDGFEDEDGCPDPDNDADGIPDELDECPDEPEVINGIDDMDGCPDEGLIELIDDRIVLEERVLFDHERSRVKARARPVIDAIVNLWRQHPEWARLRVEGHADVRGPEDYNLDLSTRRARNVMKVLIERGIPEEIIEFEGYGESRPRDTRRTPEAHERNRRVEFVVVARKSPEEMEREKQRQDEGEEEP